MEEATDILNNFFNFLIQSLPYLEKIGVTFGDEVWDDFSEANFQLFVSDVLNDKFKTSIETLYGQWSPSKGDEILVRINSGSTVLIGEVFAREGQISLTKYAEVILEEDLEFLFREFRHPFYNDEKGIAHHLKYVAGEFNKSGKIYRVAASMNICRFFI